MSRCACGQIYYDSDLGPCHQVCESCGEIVGERDNNAEDVYCGSCMEEINSAHKKR